MVLLHRVAGTAARLKQRQWRQREGGDVLQGKLAVGARIIGKGMGKEAIDVFAKAQQGDVVQLLGEIVETRDIAEVRVIAVDAKLLRPGALLGGHFRVE